MLILRRRKNVGKNQHMVPRGDSWAVRGAGNSRATSLHNTQRDAIAAARAIAQNQASELLVHGQNGQIRNRSSFGHDPHPPQG
jgi:hypothetical protein